MSKVHVVRVLPIMIALSFMPQANAEDTKLEEVIVTAQKRAERLQDVPISISAIGGSQLETRGLESARSIDGLVPNVSIKTAPGSGLIAATAIRGLATGQPAIWADASVGMYLDGVFVGKNQGALFDIADLERIEVLRGPQGTLFGRNTEGGAINFVTRKPAGTFSGNVGVEIGNYGRHVERLSVDLPKVGITSLSIALRNEEQDGWLKNDAGRAFNSKNRQAARLAANFDISPKFKVDYAYDTTHINETPPQQLLLDTRGYAQYYRSNGVGGNGSAYATYNFFQAGLGAALRATGAATDSHQTNVSAGTAGKEYFQKLDVDGHALTATYELNSTNTLKYLGSNRKMRYQDSTDLDGTTLSIFNAGRNTNYSTYSHEFQWIGNTERMNYVVGYYQFKDDGTTTSFQSGNFYTFSTAAQAYRIPQYRVTTNAKAVYGQVDYKLTDALTGTLGYRRTTEEKGGGTVRQNANSSWVPTTYQSTVNPAGLWTPNESKAAWAATTPVLALAYRVNENLNVFGRMAKGFKSGGFSLEAQTLADTKTPFNPERSTAYEVGVKTNFWNGKGQFNATLFRTDVTDFHISQLPPGGSTPVILNAGKLRSQGLELESNFVLADGWKLQANYGYLDAKFTEYMTLNQFGNMVDVAANTMVPNAAKHTFSLSLDGRLAKTTLGTLRGIMDFNYSAKYYNYAAQKSQPVGAGTPTEEIAVGNTAAESEMPARTTINARLLLTGVPVGGPGAADMSLWVRNLTNSHKMVAHIDVGGYYRIASYQDPRTYGLSFNYKW